MLHNAYDDSCSLPNDDAVSQTKGTAMRSGCRRPVLIENPRQLAAFFARCVTAEATSSSDWVAKNGDSSLFKILQRMLPEVIDAI